MGYQITISDFFFWGGGHDVCVDKITFSQYAYN